MTAFTIFAILLVLLGLLYGTLILIAVSGLAAPKQNFSSHTSDVSPVLSVIIAVRNEEHSVVACLDSISGQDLDPRLFEVIISDDASDDNTLQKIRDWIAGREQERWTVIAGGPGKKKAIEAAINRASGSCIVTTDADTLRGNGWLPAIMRAMKNEGTQLLIGPVFLCPVKSVFGKIQALEFFGISGITAGYANLRIPIMCNGANLAYRKEIFFGVGGFTGNEQVASGDDQFLLGKVKKACHKEAIRFLWDFDAVVSVAPAGGLRSFISQRIRWASKIRGIGDPLVWLTGAVTYLFQSAILTVLVAGISMPLFLYLAITMFCFKLLVDFPVVFYMASFFRKQNLWAWYIPAQLFQILYVPLTGILAWLVPVRWKGRKL